MQPRHPCRLVGACSYLLTMLYGGTLLAMSAGATHAQYPGAQPVSEDLKPGFDTIKIDDAKRILTFLVTKCAGRGTGQRGFEKAAKFVANEFKLIGLKPIGDKGTYFQRATVSASRDIRITFRGPGGVIKPGPSDYFFVEGGDRRFNGPIKLSGLPVFIEYAGKPAKLSNATALKGKVVFVHFQGDPFGDPTEVDNAEAFDEDVIKAEPAAYIGIIDKFDDWLKQGVTGGGLFHGPHWYLSGETIQNSNPGYGFVSLREQEALLKAAGIPKLKVLSPGTAAVTAGTERLTLELSGHVDSVTTENVVGLLEGADPTLKSEYVVIGGHLDHFGIQNGIVYPGADDDGSGSTAAIEVARAMAANPKRPRRSILFVTFFGEEQNLLGSRYFVAHSPVPIDKIIAQLQVDMVGRDSDGQQQQSPPEKPTIDRASENEDTVRLVGSKRISTDLDRQIRAMNAFIGFHLLDDAEYVYSRSDQINFAKKGIPVCWWFTGYHPDYHQPTDTVDKIDWVKLTNTAKHVYLSTHAVADADLPLVHDVAQPKNAAPKKQ